MSDPLNSTVPSPSDPALLPDPTLVSDPATAAAVPGNNQAAAPIDAGADAAPPQKSPLDILEEILNEQKAAPAPQGGAPKAPAEPAGPPVVDPAVRAAELAKYEQMEAERKAQDAVALQQKLVELQTIEDTPEYQARVQQDQAAEEKKTANDQAQDGFDIVQLGHTRI